MKSKQSHIFQPEASRSKRFVADSKSQATSNKKLYNLPTFFTFGNSSPVDIQHSPQNILYLQSTIGNQAVDCMIQAKLANKRSAKLMDSVTNLFNQQIVQGVVPEEMVCSTTIWNKSPVKCYKQYGGNL